MAYEMPFSEETEYTTSYYRCMDPIENFKIKVVLKPIKSLYIPLPQFESEKSSSDISNYDDNQLEGEEYTFKWQEKVLSRGEIKKYKNNAKWKKEKSKKYHSNFKECLQNSKHLRKLFSYVETDNYSVNEKNCNLFANKKSVDFLKFKFHELRICSQNVKHFKNIPKRKIINYYPTDEFKSQTHAINKNIQKMFIMVSLGLKDKDDEESGESCEYILCTLNYNLSNNVLEVTPSFSKSKERPYILGIDSQDGRNSYYFWLYHASNAIPVKNLTNEMKIMSKVFDHQEELRKLKIDTNFFSGQPYNLYVTLLGEITSAVNFEYDPVYVHYFLKLPSVWGNSDIDSLEGTTQTSYRNSYGVCYFSHLFEINFFLNLESVEDSLLSPPELFFEVLSADRYNRYRNEGYTHIAVPNRSGIYKYKLTCWRALDKSIRSQMERFFIGGGPELEDVSYVGIHTNEKGDVMSRFGFETVPSGQLEIKLSIIHQAESLKFKIGDKPDTPRSALSGIDTDSLLGSVNTVLEAFRRARQRMLETKKKLEAEKDDGLFKLKDQQEKNTVD